VNFELCNLADLSFKLKQQHYTLTKAEKVKKHNKTPIISIIQTFPGMDNKISFLTDFLKTVWSLGYCYTRFLYTPNRFTSGITSV